MPPRDNYNMSTLQEWEPLNHSFPELLAEIVPPCPGSLGWQCGIAGGGQLIQSPRGAGWARGEVPLGVWSSGLQPYFCSEPHGTFSKVSPDLIHWLVCESSKPWEDILPCPHGPVFAQNIPRGPLMALCMSLLDTSFPLPCIQVRSLIISCRGAPFHVIPGNPPPSLEAAGVHYLLCLSSALDCALSHVLLISETSACSSLLDT